MNKFLKALLLFMLTSVSLAANAQNIRIGIQQGKEITTLRIQPVLGRFQIQCQKKVATGTQDIYTEEVHAGEDAVLMLIPKGIILRMSSERLYEQGFDQVIISGGELCSLELPEQNHRMIHGRLEITHDKEKLLIVNTIPLKQYAISCASTELISCEPEAVKAHIVAIETKIHYLKTHTKHPKDNFDVCDDKHCLKYIGSGSDRELVNLLYESIPNHLLYYKDKLIYPRYHNTCGGKISSAKDVYGFEDEPYHIAHNDLLNNKGSENCFHSPSFHWTIETQLSSVEDFLSMEFAGGAENIYVNCEPLKINEEGRILMVRLRGKKVQEVQGIAFLEHLQNFYGANSIKSMRYTFEPLRRTLLIRGMGEGDGVGMCLFGADGLAKKGQSYIQILDFYYPGTTLK